MSFSKEEIDKITPVVHMNGDSGATLMKNWEAFVDSLENVKIPEIHGRNYYVKETGAEGAYEVRDKIAKSLCEIERLAREVWEKIGEFSH